MRGRLTKDRVYKTDGARDDGPVSEFETSTENDVSGKNEDNRSRGDGREAELARGGDSGGEEGVDRRDDDSGKVNTESVRRRRKVEIGENILEERRVKVVAADGDLDKNEKRAKGDGNEAVLDGKRVQLQVTDKGQRGPETYDERSVERRGLDKSRTEASNDKVLPHGICRFGRHKRIERGRRLSDSHLVVNDLGEERS